MQSCLIISHIPFYCFTQHSWSVGQCKTGGCLLGGSKAGWIRGKRLVPETISEAFFNQPAYRLWEADLALS